MKTSFLFFISPLLLLAPCTQAALTTGLVAYWNFEGNSLNAGTGADSGGSAYDGILMGDAATTGTPRAGSGALLMDGSGDYMDVTSVVDVNQPWTVSAWFLPETAPTGRGMIFENSGSFAMSYGIREGTPAANTNFQVYGDTAGGSDPFADLQVADASTIATWHHIVLSFTPATASVAGSVTGYLDGVASYSLVIPAGMTLVAGNGFHVGTYRAANDRWFDGSIDEVAMWNRTLDGTEAAGVHLAGLNNQSIPEPSVALLGGLGLLGLLRRRVS